MEAKFKVGEIVRVKDLESIGESVPFALNSCMREYSGQLLRVAAVETDCYERRDFPDFPDCDECQYHLSTLGGNNTGWSWSSPMLEKVETTSLNYKPVNYELVVDTKVDAGQRKSWDELAKWHRDMLTSIGSIPSRIIEASKPKAKDEPLKLAIKKRKIKLNFKN